VLPQSNPFPFSPPSYPPLHSLLTPSHSDAAKSTTAITSIFTIIDRKPPIDSKPWVDPEYPGANAAPRELATKLPRAIEAETFEIEFQNVEFSYPSRASARVFKRISLTIPAGKTVALVGASGSGKSTIVQLLERFYDPNHFEAGSDNTTAKKDDKDDKIEVVVDSGDGININEIKKQASESGSCLINGHDIRGLDVKWLRHMIGLVQQEPVLFQESVFDNIAYGLPNVTRDEIIEAAKAANAHDFILALEKGYETNVGPRGSKLSGGQKQRVAIARALIRNPKILVLDGK
jgi:ATP-binding cassette subfamily B (MDR/TAP) protein 1